MSQQAKASARKMRNGYAHMSGDLRRPRIKGASNRTVADAIAAARRTAAREAASRKAKK